VRRPQLHDRAAPLTRGCPPQVLPCVLPDGFRRKFGVFPNGSGDVTIADVLGPARVWDSTSQPGGINETFYSGRIAIQPPEGPVAGVAGTDDPTLRAPTADEERIKPREPLLALPGGAFPGPYQYGVEPGCSSSFLFSCTGKIGWQMSPVGWALAVLLALFAFCSGCGAVFYPRQLWAEKAVELGDGKGYGAVGSSDEEGRGAAIPPAAIDGVHETLRAIFSHRAGALAKKKSAQTDLLSALDTNQATTIETVETPTYEAGFDILHGFSAADVGLVVADLNRRPPRPSPAPGAVLDLMGPSRRPRQLHVPNMAPIETQTMRPQKQADLMQQLKARNVGDRTDL
jgi:hypothetical protein